MYLPFPRAPIDTKNPVGFTLAIFAEFLGFLYVAVVGTCVIIMAIGSYLYAIAMTKCVKGSLFSISRHAHRKKDQARVFKQIVEFIQFDSRTKQLS